MRISFTGSSRGMRADDLEIQKVMGRPSRPKKNGGQAPRVRKCPGRGRRTGGARKIKLIKGLT